MKDMENIVLFREKKIQYLNKYDISNVGVELGTEGFGTFITKVSNLFKTKINALKDIFKITGDEKRGFSNTSKVLNDEMKEVVRDINNVANKGGEFFKAVSDIVVPTIPGIKVDFFQLSNVLNKNSNLIMTSVKPLLSSVDTYMSKITNDESFRTSVAPNDLLSNIQKVSEELNKDLVSIIDAKRIDDKTQLKNFIPNLTCLKDIAINLNSSIVVKDMNLVSDIYSLNNSISTKIDNLYTLLNDKNKVRISKVRLDELCGILKVSSQLVTDTSAYIRLCDASHKLFINLIKKLEKIN